MTNLTNKSKENKPVDVFEQMAALNRPRPQETKSLEPLARMMEGAMETLTAIPMKQSYFIEDAINCGEYLAVKYCIDGEESLPYDEINWMQCRIDMDKLREYVEYWGLNEVTNDFMRGGEYRQETYTVDFDHYILDYENREHAAGEYLRDGEPTI